MTELSRYLDIDIKIGYPGPTHGNRISNARSSSLKVRVSTEGEFDRGKFFFVLKAVVAGSEKPISK